jgi:hypothetical protein
VICTPASLAQEIGLALGAQAGEAQLTDVLKQDGFTRARRATETPFNPILEARPEPPWGGCRFAAISNRLLERRGSDRRRGRQPGCEARIRLTSSALLLPAASRRLSPRARARCVVLFDVSEIPRDRSRRLFRIARRWANGDQVGHRSSSSVAGVSDGVAGSLARPCEAKARLGTVLRKRRQA